MEAFGDLARTLVLRTNQVRLREEMDTLAIEVATGLVKDSASHLGGDLTGLTAIDQSLSRLETYRINTAEAKLVAGTMQTVLDGMQSDTELLSQSLLAADLTPSETLLKTMSEEAVQTLGQVLSGLNKSVAGRHLFSGTHTDRSAVAPLDQMLGELQTALAGATDFAAVEAALDGYFGPGGGFETSIYEGSSDSLAPLRLSESETASVDIKATDAAFRDLLKPIAMAAMASDATLAFDVNTQTELLGSAGRNLLDAQKPMVEMRAGLGSLEARIEESTARNASERTATSLAKLDLVGADPYESASRYENIRSQLESLYAITARSQRLSLAEFL